jgi:hypothetical protein
MGLNYDRLAEVKNRYDATNLFCLTPNVKPTRHESADVALDVVLAAGRCRLRLGGLRAHSVR